MYMIFLTVNVSPALVDYGFSAAYVSLSVSVEQIDHLMILIYIYCCRQCIRPW